MAENITINVDTFVAELVKGLFDHMILETGIPYDEVYEEIDESGQSYLKSEYNEVYNQMTDHFTQLVYSHEVNEIEDDTANNEGRVDDGADSDTSFGV